MGVGGGRVSLGWPATAASPQITKEIYISDRTHKFQSKTRLDAKANSELYKSKRVCSAPGPRVYNRFYLCIHIQVLHTMLWVTPILPKMYQTTGCDNKAIISTTVRRLVIVGQLLYKIWSHYLQYFQVVTNKKQGRLGLGEWQMKGIGLGPTRKERFSNSKCLHRSKRNIFDFIFRKTFYKC